MVPGVISKSKIRDVHHWAVLPRMLHISCTGTWNGRPPFWGRAPPWASRLRFLVFSMLNVDWTFFQEPANNTFEAPLVGKLPGEFFNAFLLCEAPMDLVKVFHLVSPAHNLDGIGCWESRPWKHLKWHLNMTNSIKFLLPNLYMPPMVLDQLIICFFEEL